MAGSIVVPLSDKLCLVNERSFTSLGTATNHMLKRGTIRRGACRYTRSLQKTGSIFIWNHAMAAIMAAPGIAGNHAQNSSLRVFRFSFSRLLLYSNRDALTPPIHEKMPNRILMIIMTRILALYTIKTLLDSIPLV
ncbi:hypothetical protein D3C85_957670 [compost metagenome]